MRWGKGSRHRQHQAHRGERQAHTHTPRTQIWRVSREARLAWVGLAAGQRWWRRRLHQQRQGRGNDGGGAAARPGDMAATGGGGAPPSPPQPAPARSQERRDGEGARAPPVTKSRRRSGIASTAASGHHKPGPPSPPHRSRPPSPIRAALPTPASLPTTLHQREEEDKNTARSSILTKTCTLAAAPRPTPLASKHSSNVDAKKKESIQRAYTYRFTRNSSATRRRACARKL